MSGALQALFMNMRSFGAASPSSVEYLVVAGGGSGGGTSSLQQNSGGGGGAGGFRTATGLAVSAGSPYTVTVGAGGAAVSDGRNQGNDSVFSTITSTGGGGGGARPVAKKGTYGAMDGGAGGGGCGCN